MDAQGDKESDGGGLRTVTFANGSATDIGDLNSGNLTEKWNRIHWGGFTQIMPGWNLLKQVYQSEFGHLPLNKQPLMMAIIITDGEADDKTEFEDTLKTDQRAYVVLVCMGFGKLHDDVMRSYNRIAERNQRVRVVDFNGNVDPYNIARVLKRMVSP
jgi:hypothetical protein